MAIHESDALKFVLYPPNLCCVKLYLLTVVLIKFRPTAIYDDAILVGRCPFKMKPIWWAEGHT